MKSKQYILPLVIVSLTASAAVFAETHSKKSAKEWTCADFLAIDDEFKPKAVYWAAAFSKRGQEEGDILDIEGTEKVTPMIITACTKAPNDSFWTKFKEEWHKMGGHHDKKKSDKMMNMQKNNGNGNNSGSNGNNTMQ